ncbi:MAG TPA: fused MFS/spermidine synthase [Sideroxyarcus sp.]|nr:fused MFS/spermidine synthase [Sideroxyarcus sp.]
MEFSIDIREKNGVRSLHFDERWMQGAMRIDAPWHLELEYTRVMMASLLMRDDASFPRNALLIGLGAGSLAKFLYLNFPLAQLTVVEIDPRVVEAAQRYFELPDDSETLHVVIGDGVEYISVTDETYDLILVDGFNEHAHPGDLNTLPFYQACRSRLSEQGLLAVNLIGLSRGYKGGFVHIEAAFDGRAMMFPMCQSGNTIAFAAAGAEVHVPLAELKCRAMKFEEHTSLALMPDISGLEHSPACPDGVLRI